MQLENGCCHSSLNCRATPQKSPFQARNGFVVYNSVRKWTPVRPILNASAQPGIRPLADLYFDPAVFDAPVLGRVVGNGPRTAIPVGLNAIIGNTASGQVMRYDLCPVLR